MKRAMRWLLPVLAVVVIVVVLGGVLLAKNGGPLGSVITSTLDPEDVTPAASSSSLNGVWYGSLYITRYDPQTNQPSEHLTEAFYLKLTLRTDNTIIGTYATCPTDKPVSQQALQEYDISSGVIYKSNIHLYIFGAMYGTVTGTTMSLNGMRYPPHSDFPSDQYTSVLHKVDASSYLSACHIVYS